MRLPITVKQSLALIYMVQSQISSTAVREIRVFINIGGEALEAGKLHHIESKMLSQ